MSFLCWERTIEKSSWSFRGTEKKRRRACRTEAIKKCKKSRLLVNQLYRGRQMTSEKISKRKVFFLEHHISRLKQLFNDTRNRSETERERKEFRLVDVAMWMKFAYEKEHFKHFIYLSLCDLHSLSCSWSWFLLFACFSLSVF